MADYSSPSQTPQGSKPMNNNTGGNSAKTLKTVTAILAVALVACLIALFYVSNQKRDTETQLGSVTTEKEQVTSALEQLKVDYADLRTNNDTINAQLTKERQKIDLLLDKIKRTDASNRSKIKEYEKEVTSLRTLMKGYVRQIDSLNNLNQQLKAENAEIKQKATESAKKIDELSQKSDNLQSMVAKGGVVKARDIVISAINSRDKDVSKAKQTVKIRTCLVLNANSIAEKGTRSLYIRVKSPDGSLLTNSPENLFDVDGVRLVYSAMREVDYQGDDLEVCVFYADTDFMAGTYTVEVYLGGILAGTSQMLLK